MATEQYFQESTACNDFNGKAGPSLEKWKAISNPVGESENSSSGDFECNICLDSVQDPVVTLCGHLFCWPCIYKWIHLQSASTKNQSPQCPVCKTEVSQRTLVPLYGRGHSAKPSEGKSKKVGITVPRRPTPTCVNNHAPRHLHSYPDLSQANSPHPVFSYGDVPTTDAVHLVPSMFGEMVYARIFGNSETIYTYPNSYHSVGNNSPRLRRQLMQADESLGRICFFFFCCVVLCLFLF